MKEEIVNSQIYILKCTIAGICSIILADNIGLDDNLSASFVAIICIKPTFYSGLITGKQQFIASFWGGAITGALIILFGKGILVTALSLLIVISLCVYQNWSNHLMIATFTVLYMFLIPHETIEGVIIRILSVFLGVAVASVINFVMSFIRYKKFFYSRVKYATNLVLNKFNQTIIANQNADITYLSHLYYDYENVYYQLSGFSSEVLDTIKELKIRKNTGGLSIDDLEIIYRVIESLKMSVRYLQDITYISKSLAPRHLEIPQKWKDKIDDFWKIEKNRLEKIVNKIEEEVFQETEIVINFDIQIINEIADEIKIDNSKKDVYREFMAIIIDFQQLHFTISSLEYSIGQYNRIEI